MAAANARHGSGLSFLLIAQALSTFNHNLLRAALLTLVSFRGLTAAGFDAETVVAISTLVIVLPYVILSLPAGRLADRYAKSTLLRQLLALDVVILALGAASLGTGNVALLVLTLLLAGVQAALLGPAKFAILPELVAPEGLTASNGLMNAYGTAAVLAGMILGNLLILDATGFWLVSIGCVMLAVLAWLLSRRIAGEVAKDPLLSLTPGAIGGDFREIVTKLRRNPLIAWSVLGSCWFWFQGTVCTTLIPLYIAQTGQAPFNVSILLLAVSAGVVLGSISAHWLLRRLTPFQSGLGVAIVIGLPSLDFAFMHHLPGAETVARVALDMFIAAIGAGFYLVPLTTAIQSLAPTQERARFIGVSHTLSGLAMCLGGVVMLVHPLVHLSLVQTYALLTIASGLVAGCCLFITLGTNRTAAPATAS